jgi:hypothetical protein
MVHFPGFAHTRLCIQRAVIWFYQIGFPHSEILGSKLACSSPRLIAACHVLHRLLAPRHPPYALSSLTIKLTQHDPSSGSPQNNRKSLASPSSPFFGVLCLTLAFRLRQAHRAWSKFAFPHCATLEQKFAVFRATQTLKFASRDAYFLQLSKIARSNHLFPIGTSPLPAERTGDLEPPLRFYKP